MCYDLSEYNPFEPLWLYSGGSYSYREDTVLEDEPMEDYNWEEWLETNNETDS